MHPRNRYSKEPADFGELAQFRPSLKPFLIDKHRGCRTSVKEDSSSQTTKQGSGFNPVTTKLAYTLDFSDPAALRELTCAVLEKDFGLKLEIPLGVLIPTVPQKLNYIHWIEDLLTPTVGVVLGAHIPKGIDTIGIDIGNSKIIILDDFTH